MQHHRAVLADGVEHNRIMALGSHLPHDVDAFRLKVLKVSQAGWPHPYFPFNTNQLPARHHRGGMDGIQQLPYNFEWPSYNKSVR